MELVLLSNLLHHFQSFSSSIPLEDQQKSTEPHINEEDEESVVKAIEQIQYFVEDLDHAKGVLPVRIWCVIL